MPKLLLSLTVFTVLHLIPSTPLRPALIRALGRPAFMALFSATSTALFVWVYVVFRGTPIETVFWTTGHAVRGLSALVMLLAFLLLTLAVCERRPMLLTGESVLSEPGSIRGVLRVTRHPALWAIGLWALAHMINNANPPAWAFFGYAAALAFGGALLIDRRRRRLLPAAAWERLQAETSSTPFLAIASGRNQMAWREFALWKIALAVVLWAGMMHGHPHLFGVVIF
jgi:uncharacterized membrane protein